MRLLTTIDSREEGFGMLCQEIIDIIEKSYPEKYALDWDNVGLLAGRDDKEVTRIYIALDATDEVVEAAAEQGADMLITHHPLIFGGLRQVTNRDFIGRRIIKLLQNDISYYAMHTNYDVLGMADLSGRMLHLHDAEVLEVTWDDGSKEGIGRVADLEESISLAECAEAVKASFNPGPVKVFGELGRRIKRVAISPGAGKSMIGAALGKKADVLVTGDIDHHTGIDAVAEGLCIIDAGHYGVEHIFVEDMKRYLEEHAQGIEVAAAPIRHPFVII